MNPAADDEGVEAPPNLTQAIEDAVKAAVRQDELGIRDALMRAADECFPAGLGYACFTWARMAAAAIIGSPAKLEQYIAQGMTAGVQFTTGDGALINAEDTDPAVRFVGRMIACALNGDSHAAIDVWATLDDDVMAEAAVGMVRFAASAVMRRTLADHGGNPGALL